MKGKKERKKERKKGRKEGRKKERKEASRLWQNCVCGSSLWQNFHGVQSSCLLADFATGVGITMQGLGVLWIGVWVELGSVVLGWVELRRVGLGWVGLGWVEQSRVAIPTLITSEVSSMTREITETTLR